MPAINPSPLVSVVMPMRNAEAYVLHSVNSILNQSFHKLELIVIDDGSTDKSRSLLESVINKDKRLQVLDGSGKGISAAKNLGLNYANGDIVMFCDADDYFPDDRISRQVDWLNAHPEAGAVCGSYVMVDNQGGNHAVLDTGKEEVDISDELLSGKTRTHLCTFAVRSQFANGQNQFREFFTSAEDIDFQLRLAEGCRVFYSPAVNYYYRLHDSSITHQQASNKRQFYEQMARSFRRQRHDSGKDDLQNGITPAIPEDKGSATRSNVQLQGILIGNAWQLFDKGQQNQAILKGFEACKINMVNPTAWKSFFMLLLKSLKS